MPNRTIYLSDDDAEKFDSLSNKSAFVASAMNTHVTGKNIATYHPNMAMPTSLEEANDPNSPGYSALVQPDVKKKELYPELARDIKKAGKTQRALDIELMKKSKGGMIPDKDIERVIEMTLIPAQQRGAKGVCKIHGIPLDDRGKCLQKGCKYA